MEIILLVLLVRSCRRQVGKGKVKAQAEGSTQTKGRGKGSFAEMTEFYRNLIVHCNDHIPEIENKKDDATISAEADLMFGSVCSILRHSLTTYWYRRGNNGYGLNHQEGLLSSVFRLIFWSPSQKGWDAVMFLASSLHMVYSDKKSL